MRSGTPLVLLLVTACGPKGAPLPALGLADGTPVSVDGMPAAQVECLLDRCQAAGSAELFAACSVESCPTTPECFAVHPRAVRFDAESETLTVHATIEHADGAVRDSLVVRDRPIHVGVTVITSTGEEIDLSVQSLFPGNFDQPVQFAAQVGPDIQDIVFGVWDRKVEPCDSERMGCQQFGFLLDGPLASWPPAFYQDGQKQRITPVTVTLQPVYGGGPPERFINVREAVARQLTRELEAFGSTVTILDTVLADEPGDHMALRHRHPHDGVVTAAMLSNLNPGVGGPPSGSADAALAADFSVTFGGDDDTLYQCAREACDGLVGDALHTCLLEDCNG